MVTHGWVVTIEGLGRTSLRPDPDTDGALIRPMACAAVGGHLRPTDSRLDVYTPVLVPGSVAVGGSSFSPIEGDALRQTLSFRLMLHPDFPEVLSYFFDDPELIGEATNVGPIDDEITLAGTDTPSLVAGDIVYCRREAFRVASVGAGVIGVVDAVPDPAGYFPPISEDVLRASADPNEEGHIGTAVARYFDATANGIIFDRRVWRGTPFLRGRAVVLWRVSQDRTTGAVTESIWGRYVMDGSPELESDGTVVRVSCTSLAGSIAESSFNAFPAKFRLGPVQEDGSASVFLVQEPPPTARNAAGFSIVREIVTLSDGRRVASGVGDVSFTDGYVRIDPGGFTVTPEAPLFRGELFNRGVPVGEEPRGVFTYTLTNRSYFSAERPLDRMLAHLSASDFDNRLPGWWTVPTEMKMVDRQSIETLGNTALAGIEDWPGIFAGGDGRPINAFKWLDDTFLRPLGLGWAVRPPGHARAGSLYVEQVAGAYTTTTALALPQIQSGRAARREGSVVADSITSTAGSGAGSPAYEIQSIDLYDASFSRGSPRTISIPAEGAVDPNSDLPADLFESIPGLVRVRAYLSSLAAVLRKGAQVYAIRTATGDPSDPIRYYAHPGSLVEISTQPPGGILRAGEYLVLEQSLSTGMATQDLRLLRLPFATSRIGPSGRVVSVSSVSGAWRVVLSDRTTRPDPYRSPKGDASNDADTFDLAGTSLEVIVLDENLANPSAPVALLAAGSDWIEIPGTAPEPAVGAFVALASTTATGYTLIGNAASGRFTL